MPKLEMVCPHAVDRHDVQMSGIGRSVQKKNNALNLRQRIGEPDGLEMFVPSYKSR